MTVVNPTPVTRTPIDVIAAIHHPVRRRLLELLHLDGPNTVSGLADAAGERVGNASHHLKVLAEAGLVQEAPELAKDRRERWWRAVEQGGFSWSIADVDGDPLAEVIASAAEQQNLAHHVAKVQQWFAHREEYDAGWVRAAFSTENWISVTPAELEELSRRVNDLFLEYSVKSRQPADTDRERVYVFAHGVPAKP